MNAQQQAAAERRAHIIAETEFLLGTDHPTRIATRLGYLSAKSLERVLDKWGRGDLARHFRTEVAA